MKKVLTTVPVDTGTTVQIRTDEIPIYVGLNVGQALMEAIRRDMQDPERAADYLRWKAEREARLMRGGTL